MQPLTTLTERISVVREALKAADYATQARDYELRVLDERVKKYGQNEASEKEAADIFKKYAPKIIEARTVAKTIKKEIEEYKPAWLSVEHILSTRPVSATGENLFQAKDASVEAMTRMSMSAELKNATATQLHLRAADAKQSFRYGELFLIYQEMNSRDTKSPGWAPIDLSGVVLHDQHKAKGLFSELTVSVMAAEQMALNAIGARIDPTDKLAFGHAVVDMESYNTNPPPAYQPTIQTAAERPETTIEKLSRGYADKAKEA
jgi:hypothetical protein